MTLAPMNPAQPVTSTFNLSPLVRSAEVADSAREMVHQRRKHVHVSAPLPYRKAGALEGLLPFSGP